MRWTTEKPTKPGWYWFEDALTPLRIVHLRQGEDDLHVEGALISRVLFWCGKWAGPIEPPTAEGA